MKNYLVPKKGEPQRAAKERRNSKGTVFQVSFKVECHYCTTITVLLLFLNKFVRRNWENFSFGIVVANKKDMYIDSF